MSLVSRLRGRWRKDNSLPASTAEEEPLYKRCEACVADQQNRFRAREGFTVTFDAPGNCVIRMRFWLDQGLYRHIDPQAVILGEISLYPLKVDDYFTRFLNTWGFDLFDATMIAQRLRNILEPARV